MKRLLFILLVCPILTFAQKSKGKGYLKVSPSINFVKNSNVVPAINGAFGGRIGDQFAIGVSTGYFKIYKMKGAILPVGVDLSFLNFKKKVSPALTLQVHYPVHSGVERLGSGSSYSENKTTGKYFAGVNAGVSLPVKRKHILLTIGYSELGIKNTYKYRSGTGYASDISTIKYKIVTGTISLVL